MWVYAFVMLLVGSIGYAFYDPYKKNRAIVLMGLTCFTVFAFWRGSMRDSEKIDANDLGGKIALYCFCAYIGTVIKDWKDGARD